MKGWDTMFSTSYSSYLERVSEVTANYVKWLLDYMIIGEDVSINSYKLKSKEKDFYYALKAYQHSNKANGNYLSSIGFNDTRKLLDESRSHDSRELMFRKYSSYFLPDFDEELEVLTPEDIIINIYKRSSLLEFFTIFDLNPNDFISNMRKYGGVKKENMKNELRKTLLSSLPISTINYFDMAGNLFYYLRENSSEQESFNVDRTLSLSLLLAIFYFNQVGGYSDKEQIIAFFNNIGLTKSEFEKSMNVHIDEAKLSEKNSILIINRYYKNLLDKLKSEDKTYVTEVLNYVVHNGLDGNIYFIKEI